MTAEFLAKLKRWISDGDIQSFYRTRIWRNKRAQVLELDKHECQWCKAKGLYTPADTVHHVQYVEKHPELALSDFYEYDGKRYRQLVSVCRACHEAHHERGRGQTKKKPLTEERW